MVTGKGSDKSNVKQCSSQAAGAFPCSSPTLQNAAILCHYSNKRKRLCERRRERKMSREGKTLCRFQLIVIWTGKPVLLRFFDFHSCNDIPISSKHSKPQSSIIATQFRDGVTDWQVVCVYVCICFLWHSPSYPESHLTLLATNQLLNEIFHWANALHNADWKTENRMWRNEISNQQMLWYVNKAIKLCCRCHGFTLRDHFCPCIHGFFLLFPLFLIGTW